MRVRLRRLTRTRSGKPVAHDTRLDVDVLTIGRGTDNALQLSGLRVPLHHSALIERPGGLVLEPREPRPLVVNGVRTAGARPVATGDAIGVGSHTIRVLPREADGAVALELEETRVDGTEIAALLARTTIGVERGWFTRRKLAWAAAAAVLVAGAWTRAGGHATSAAWSPGPVAHVHAFVGHQCATCHTTPFAPVADTACTACHRSVGPHVAPGRPVPAALETTRCASCHPEHRGEARLAGDGGLCAECHADLRRRVADTALPDVRGFGAAGGHPALARAALAGAPGEPADLRADPLLLRHGLRFPHALHLRPGLRGRRADAAPATLVCASCHVPDAGGARMQPVRFAERCQACHDLRFSDDAPERQAPHPAEPAAVEADLFEFFAARALANGRDADAPGPARRRPDEEAVEAARIDALAWARRAAARAREDLLGGPGAPDGGACATCHPPSADGGIVPLTLPARWMPGATFSHAAHRTTPCGECHRLDAAAGATGMLPALDACTRCHAPGGARRGLDDCVVCHAMHRTPPAS